MTNPYDQNEEVSKVLVKVVQEVSEVSNVSDELRLPSIGENLYDLHVRLLAVRARQQRASELVGTLIRIQANVRKLVLDRKSELDAAEAKAVIPSKQAFVEDFSSAQERNARLRSKTLNERVSLTAAEKLQVDVDAALAYAQQVYRQLGNQSYDVNTRIKVLGMEGTLD